MKIKSNYLNAFHVANLSLSISLLCVCQVFFSPFFFLFFSHFIFSVLFLVVRRPPIFRGRSFLSQNLEGMCCIYMYIYMCVCVWRLKEDYNLFSVSCSLLFEFAYQTENLPFLLINCL